MTRDKILVLVSYVAVFATVVCAVIPASNWFAANYGAVAGACSFFLLVSCFYKAHFTVIEHQIRLSRGECP